MSWVVEVTADATSPLTVQHVLQCIFQHFAEADALLEQDASSCKQPLPRHPAIFFTAAAVRNPFS